VDSILAITVGALLVVPAIVSFIRTVVRLRKTEQLVTGHAQSGAGLIVMLVGGQAMSLAGAVHGVPLVVGLLAIAAYLTAIALIQSRLNTVWLSGGVDLAAPASDRTLAV
jgi:hypothetical protein